MNSRENLLLSEIAAVFTGLFSVTTAVIAVITRLLSVITQ